MNARRRTVLALLAGSGLVAACGFKLRGAESAALPFKTVYLGFAETSPLGAELRRYIRAVGSTEIVADPKLADAILDVLFDAREESILSLNAQGRVRELSLYHRFRFRLRDPKNRELVAPTEILLRRDMNFNEAQVLAKDAEKQLLYRDMQSDLVQQILRRLAAYRPTAAVSTGS